MLYSIGFFLFVITIVVSVHEAGHYFLARRFRVAVRKFSIGFGPQLLGWSNARGTRFCLSLVPLGGYVRMAGWTREEVEELPVWERGEAFLGKSLFARACIVVAGPVANFILAILLFTVLYTSIGAPQKDEGAGVVLSSVVEGSPAEQAGLRAGDRLMALDGRRLSSPSDLIDGVATSEGKPIALEVVAQGQSEEDSAKIVVRASKDAEGRYLIGVILSTLSSEPLSLPFALLRACETTFDISRTVLSAVGDLITGRRGLDELAGPVRLAQVSGDAARAGWVPLLFFTAFLSINLGLLNLLPIPLLDGGYLLLYALESLRGKPLGERVESWLLSAGFAFLILLMVWVTGQDVLRLLGI